MCLPPIEFYYQCPTKGQVITRSYRPMGVPPRFVKCNCGHTCAELIFDNPLQKISHQKKLIRNAGSQLEKAGIELGKENLKDPLIAKNIELAGKSLKELP